MNPHYHKYEIKKLCIGCSCCVDPYPDYEDTKLTEPIKEQPKDK